MTDEETIDYQILRHKDKCRSEVNVGMQELKDAANANVSSIKSINERLEAGNLAFSEVRSRLSNVESETEKQGKQMAKVIGGAAVVGCLFGTIAAIVMFVLRG